MYQCALCYAVVFVNIRALAFLTFWLSLPASLQKLPDNKVNREVHWSFRNGAKRRSSGGR